jgi:HK97 family phage prohead protease
MYGAGCFSGGLDGDLFVLAQHDSRLVLGRKAAHTAMFWEESDGLHAQADLLNVTYASDLLLNMRAKNITGASACFYILAVEWKGKTRIITRAKLLEASIVTNPAYSAASAAVTDSLLGEATSAETGLYGRTGGGAPEAPTRAVSFSAAGMGGGGLFLLLPDVVDGDFEVGEMGSRGFCAFRQICRFAQKVIHGRTVAPNNFCNFLRVRPTYP